MSYWNWIATEYIYVRLYILEFSIFLEFYIQHKFWEVPEFLQV